MTALLLLAPGTPMLFQGQEFGVDAAVPLLRRPRRRAGRAGAPRGGASSWRSSRRSPTPDAQAALADPARRETFARCKLDCGERERARGDAARCTAICSRCGATTRRSRQQRADRMHGAVLGDQALALRFSLATTRRAGDRLLLVNLGADLPLSPVAGAAARAAARRALARCCGPARTSRYGGGGDAGARDRRRAGVCPAHAALVLAPEHAEREPR